MKERVTASVGLEPPSEIAPPLNLVDRLVLDEPLQHHRRRSPVDSAEHEEPAVEPASEQVRQVSIDARPLRMRRQRSHQVAPQLDECRRGAGGQVQAPEQFLSWRFGSRLQSHEGF